MTLETTLLAILAPGRRLPAAFLAVSLVALPAAAQEPTRAQCDASGCRSEQGVLFQMRSHGEQEATAPASETYTMTRNA